MPTVTFTPLATVTLTSPDNSITFSSIPGTYRDLVVVYRGHTIDSGNFDVQISFNGITTGYSFIAVGRETAPYSYGAASINTINPGVGNQTVGVYEVLDYSSTNKHKSTLIKVDAAARTVGRGLQRFASNDAVTSMTISIGAGSYNTGSTFSLYGIHG